MCPVYVCVRVMSRIHMCHAYVCVRVMSRVHMYVWHWWVMSHIWMSHVTHMNESCHKYQWVMPHICVTLMSHVTGLMLYLEQSCHAYRWVMSHVWTSHPFIRATWLIDMCDMIHSHVCHDSSICVAWLIHMCDIAHSYARSDSFICDPLLLYATLPSPMCVGHDSFICVTLRSGARCWRRARQTRNSQKTWRNYTRRLKQRHNARREIYKRLCKIS